MTHHRLRGLPNPIPSQGGPFATHFGLAAIATRTDNAGAAPAARLQSRPSWNSHAAGGSVVSDNELKAEVKIFWEARAMTGSSLAISLIQRVFCGGAADLNSGVYEAECIHWALRS